MAINTSLLIAAPMLQDYLVDKSTGLPLVQGTVTLYQDNSRTTLKNWYYQTGTPGNYTYITLPNPLTLSAVGTIVDVNGNDTIPFFYPYSELDNSTPQAYYITVDSSSGTRQFTRQNFPFVPPSSSSTNSNPTWQNYIYNNVFWRNIGSINGTQFSNTAQTISLNSSTFYYVTLAPSQHDGMTMTDIQYFKNTKDATETLTFNKFVGNFADNILTNDVTPEFYLNLNCTGAGTETSKYIQIPIQLHVDNLSGYTQASVSIWAQDVGGNPNNQITLKLFQFLGTGVTSPSATTLRTITTTNTWEKYTVNFTFPTSQSLTLSGAGDDTWYLQIGFPTAVTSDINIAKPSVFLSQTQPTDEFQNYDQVETIINSPRTGDIRSSLNSFSPYGWVPMNDGTIGNASSASTTRANIDTWPLFNLLWQSFNAYTSGSTNPIAQMQNSSGTNVAYGASAYADFNANNRLALTKMMGKVLMGTVPLSNLLASSASINGFSADVVFSNSAGNILVTVSGGFLLGFYYGGIVTFQAQSGGGVLPTGVTANTLYYTTPVSGTTFLISTSFANVLAGTYVTFTDAGTSPNKAFCFPAGAFEGEYSHTQTVAELAAHTHTFACNHSTSDTVTVTFNGEGAGQFNTATSSTGSSSPFNIVQPSTYMNMYIKL